MFTRPPMSFVTRDDYLACGPEPLTDTTYPNNNLTTRSKNSLSTFGRPTTTKSYANPGETPGASEQRILPNFAGALLPCKVISRMDSKPESPKTAFDDRDTKSPPIPKFTPVPSISSSPKQLSSSSKQTEQYIRNGGNMDNPIGKHRTPETIGTPASACSVLRGVTAKPVCLAGGVVCGSVGKLRTVE